MGVLMVGVQGWYVGSVIVGASGAEGVSAGDGVLQMGVLV